MAKHLLILFCLFGTIHYGCREQEMFSTYVMRIGDELSHDKDLRIDLEDIIDSRCPLSVICVWEGQAECAFQLTFQNDMVVTDTLISRIGRPELAIGHLGEYKITLLDVSPYPEEPDQLEPEDYVIRLMVEE